MVVADACAFGVLCLAETVAILHGARHSTEPHARPIARPPADLRPLLSGWCVEWVVMMALLMLVVAGTCALVRVCCVLLGSNRYSCMAQATDYHARPPGPPARRRCAASSLWLVRWVCDGVVSVGCCGRLCALRVAVLCLAETVAILHDTSHRTHDRTPFPPDRPPDRSPARPPARLCFPAVALSGLQRWLCWCWLLRAPARLKCSVWQKPLRSSTTQNTEPTPARSPARGPAACAFPLLR